MKMLRRRKLLLLRQKGRDETTWNLFVLCYHIDPDATQTTRNHLERNVVGNDERALIVDGRFEQMGDDAVAERPDADDGNARWMT